MWWSSVWRWKLLYSRLCLLWQCWLVRGQLGPVSNSWWQARTYQACSQICWTPQGQGDIIVFPYWALFSAILAPPQCSLHDPVAVRWENTGNARNAGVVSHREKLIQCIALHKHWGLAVQSRGRGNIIFFAHDFVTHSQKMIENHF
jgi:hypothetical protein